MPVRHLLKCLGLAGAIASAHAQDASLAGALDTPEWPWQSGGDLAWKSVPADGGAVGGSVAEARATGPAGGWFGADCLLSWMETAVTGPGTLAIDVRHNHNPYTRVSLLVDGAESAIWDIWSFYQNPPDSGFSPWRRLTAALPDGVHSVRIVHDFGCQNEGTLYINQPAVQVDNVRLLPPLEPAGLDDIDRDPGEIWLAGGSVDFQHLTGPEAHDGADGLRAPAVAATPSGDRPEPAWLQHTVTGPSTLTWWERSHTPVNQPWLPRVLFIPPGPHTFRWNAFPSGQDIDSIASTPSPEIPLEEALDAAGRAFTQSGAAWHGVQSAAAPDGQDTAWVRVMPGTNASLESIVSGPATVRFQLATSAAIESGGNLTLSINGRSVTLLGDRLAVVVPAGQHHLRWTAQGPAFAPGPATVMLDAVEVAAATESPLGEALDAPELTWSTGPLSWVGLSTSAAPDGVDAAVPPDLADGDSAWIETTVTGPGRLSFLWPLADQAEYSSTPTPLRLVIDGQQVLAQSVSHTAPLVEVGPGPHTFRWVATGQSMWRLGALDQVRWEPLPAAPRLVALGNLPGPLAAPAASQAFVTAAASHQGDDALRLVPTPGSFQWLAAPSLTTWHQGPGHLFYWYRPAHGAAFLVNDSPAPDFNRDGDWRRGILAIPPGWRVQTWSVPPSSVPETSVDLDDLQFIPVTPITLDSALPIGSPWRTAPEAPWVGLPADFIVNTFPSAQAPAAATSWLESTVTGPCVVAFSTTGSSLHWQIDQRFAGSPPSGLPAWRRSSLFVPEGTHSVRWVATNGEPAGLATVSLHPAIGTLDISSTAESAFIHIPRPRGFRDSQISLQYTPTGTFWLNEFAARIHTTSDDAIVFSVPITLLPSRLWRAAFAPD